MSGPRREPALEDLDAGQFLSDSDDHFTSHQPPLTGYARARASSPLELSRALQTRLAQLRGTPGGEALIAPRELTARLRMNVEALHVELAELLHETPWKEWKTYSEDWYTEDRRAAIKEEAIDVYFFLNNIFLALGMNDIEVQALYELKFEKNMARQADGGTYR